MNIGMTLPVMERDLSRDILLDWIRRIDHGPWSSIAMGERIVFHNPEFITLLGGVAAATNKTEIIATISVATMHNPVLLAKQIATLDMLSEGRFTLGVGVGGREEDYLAIGADYSKRRWANVEDNINTMKSIWAGEHNLHIGPKPFTSRGPQILAGALGPKALEISSTFADGIAGFSFNADINEIKESFDLTKKFFKPNPRLMTSFWFAIEPNGRVQLKSHLQSYLAWMGDEIAEMLSDSAGFCGSVSELKGFLEQISNIGASDILLVPTSKDIKQLKMLEEIIF